MDGAAKFIFVAVVLGNLWEYSEGQSLFREHYRKYDNTSLVRFRRQATGQSCKGDDSKFQCLTTADCIDNNLKCDGKEDCPDRSDEKESLCTNFFCRTPAQPEHGKWTYLNNRLVAQPSILVASGTNIVFSCNENYKLSSTNEKSHYIVCLPDGTWSTTDFPTCLKLCPKVNNSPILTVACRTDGYVVPCDKATDLTVLVYKCAPYYEPPYGRPEKSICFDGKWDYTPECITVCGEKRASASTLVVNGDEVERGNYPWVVALYSSKDLNTEYMNICGGSLISTTIVLTAAHCVTKKEQGKPYPIKYFRVAAGKYYNEYGDARDKDTAQYSEVQEIVLHRDYRGELHHYRGDIAILRLKTPLVLSKVVQPVCYDNLPAIRFKDIGLVAGWGYTTPTGQPSEKLKELELPYTDDTQCADEFDSEFSNTYFISDKMCAGFYNQNTSVCKGDSGGGLVFKNPHYKNRYFIHGIVSLAHVYRENEQFHCNVQRSALFTRVVTYLEWIQLTVRRLNANNNVEQTPNKTCTTPAQPVNGQWFLLNNYEIGAANLQVNVHTVLVFICKESYKLSSTNELTHSMVCRPDGSWSTTVIPTCQKEDACSQLGLPATCQNVKNCKIALDLLKNKGRHDLKKCGSVTDQEFVCCPDLSGGNSTIENTTSEEGTIWPDENTPQIGNNKDRINFVLTKRKSEKMCEKFHADYKTGIYIVNDKGAALGEFPHMALLGFSDGDKIKWICGASLISTKFLLTVAHCLLCSACRDPVKARLGVVDKNDHEYAQDVDIKNTTIHPDYNIISKHNDIAIVELVQNVQITDIIYPACLYTKVDDPPGLHTAGWGVIKDAKSKDQFLQSAVIEPVPITQCNATVVAKNPYSSRVILESQICGMRQSDACTDGYSGSTLQFKEQKGAYVIVGVVSYGARCGTSIPDIFTRVSAYLDWIEQIVWPGEVI